MLKWLVFWWSRVGDFGVTGLGQRLESRIIAATTRPPSYRNEGMDS